MNMASRNSSKFNLRREAPNSSSKLVAPIKSSKEAPKIPQEAGGCFLVVAGLKVTLRYCRRANPQIRLSAACRTRVHSF